MIRYIVYIILFTLFTNHIFAGTRRHDVADSRYLQYGLKYESTKNKLLDIKGTIDALQSQVFKKSLEKVNNQLTGSYNQLTGSIETKINNTTGSI